MNNIFIEKYKNMLGNTDFQQDHYSRTSLCVYEVGHDNFRLMNYLAYYDRSYHENINCYDLLGPILKFLNEIS